MPIKLIIGLGNPGDKYQKTRHNVGFWLLDQINTTFEGALKKEPNFFGQVSKVRIGVNVCWLLKPDTFMNLSGKPVQVLANYYQINPDEMLVLHDELDIPTGTVRFKTGGGHGGHNGLRDIMSKVSSRDFHRIRIGIDRPTDAKQMTNYVLGKPSIDDVIDIKNAISRTLLLMEEIVAGQFDHAMNQLHSK